MIKFDAVNNCFTDVSAMLLSSGYKIDSLGYKIDSDSDRRR